MISAAAAGPVAFAKGVLLARSMGRAIGFYWVDFGWNGPIVARWTGQFWEVPGSEEPFTDVPDRFGVLPCRVLSERLEPPR